MRHESQVPRKQQVYSLNHALKYSEHMVTLMLALPLFDSKEGIGRSNVNASMSDVVVVCPTGGSSQTPICLPIFLSPCLLLQGTQHPGIFSKSRFWVTASFGFLQMSKTNKTMLYLWGRNVIDVRANKLVTPLNKKCQTASMSAERPAGRRFRRFYAGTPCSWPAYPGIHRC